MTIAGRVNFQALDISLLDFRYKEKRARKYQIELKGCKCFT
jgi:hypothetical protein